MVALAFDTLDAARTLRNAGVDERTAEAIVHIVQRTAELPDISHLATKQDVAALRDDITRLEAGTKADITRLESRFDGTATKADITRLESGTKADIVRLESRFDGMATKADITRLEAATKAETTRLESRFDGMATKADITRLEAATKADIARLESATKADVARLESRFEATATKEALNALRLEVVELRGEVRNLGPELKADLSERIRANTLATLAYMTALIGAAFAAVKFIH